MTCKITLAAVALFAVLTVAACSFSTTFAESLSAGEAALAILDASLEATVAPYFNAAITAVQNWKSGPLSTEAVEALGILANNLDLLPSKDQKFDTQVAAIINLIDNTIAGSQKANAAQVKTPAEQEAFFAGWIETDSGTPAGSAGRKHQWHGKQIKTPAQLKKALKSK